MFEVMDEDIPTSSAVSDDPVNNTSPYFTSFCFSPELTSTVSSLSKSISILSKIFLYEI